MAGKKSPLLSTSPFPTSSSLLSITVQDFDAWAAKLTKALPLYHLKGSVVGCDAAHFLRSLHREPLLSALGGSPLALGSKIAEAVTYLRDAGLVLHFVFNGLDFGVKGDPFTASASTTQAVDNAFELYESKSAQQAKNVFEAAGILGPSKSTETGPLIVSRYTGSHCIDEDFPKNAP